MSPRPHCTVRRSWHQNTLYIFVKISGVKVGLREQCGRMCSAASQNQHVGVILPQRQVFGAKWKVLVANSSPSCRPSLIRLHASPEDRNTLGSPPKSRRGLSPFLEVI